ncbi:MAG: hypothetical protein WC982_05205 [Advenella sp.]
MARFSAQDMLKPKTDQGSRSSTPPQPAATKGPQAVQVPKGGQVTIRKVSNGVVATVTDSNWRNTQEVIASKASDLKIE